VADERELSAAEVRRTISTSLAAAFGFVIALLWSNVVLGGLATGGISLTAPSTPGNWVGWIYGVIVGVVLTIVMIVLIIVIGRWGSKA